MKAIILAAGIGSRLRPITNQKPKTLAEVNNKPIIGHLIDSLARNEIRDVILCIGFEAEKVINYCKINYPNINFTFLLNKDYYITNNMYSLYLAMNYFDDDIILMNGDVIIDPDIIGGLRNQEFTSIAVDVGRYIEESMKVIVTNNEILTISKKIGKSDAYGCSIDIYKINKNDLKIIKNELIRIIETENDKNQWTEVMLDNLFKNRTLIAKPYNIEHKKWYEIDTCEDLLDAELLFNKKINDLNSKKIFFIDVDGTVLLGNDIIDGAVEFVNKIKKLNKKFFFTTNNSSKTPSEFLRRFNKAGIDVTLDNILVSTQSVIAYLQRDNIKRIFWVANKEVSQFLINNNFIFDNETPQALLLTYNNQITYEDFERLTYLVRKGIPYYATHSDIVCPTPKGNIPDIGTFIKVIELTTGILPNKIFGKPDRLFIKPVLDKYGFTYKDAVMIGDRLYTDIKLAENSDITSILVLTGETKRDDYEFSLVKASIVIKSIKEIIDFI